VVRGSFLVVCATNVLRFLNSSPDCLSHVCVACLERRHIEPIFFQPVNVKRCSVV